MNVYRFVTAASVEEKIIERAQQKLKLDAMVVQQGKTPNVGLVFVGQLARFNAPMSFRDIDIRLIVSIVCFLYWSYLSIYLYIYMCVCVYRRPPPRKDIKELEQA